MILTHSMKRTASRTKANCLVIGVFSNSEIGDQLNAAGYATCSSIVAQAKAEEFTSKSGQTLTHFTGRKSPAFVVLVGLGESKELKPAAVCSALVTAVKAARSHKCKSIAVAPLSLEGTAVSHTQYGHAIAEAAMLAQYSFHYKTERGGHKEEPQVETLEVLHPNQDVQAALSEGQVIAQAIAFARRLSDTPASHLGPDDFRKQTIEVLARSGGKLAITVLDKHDLLKMGANGILAVGSGSAHPCFLIELAYTPRTGATDKVLGLIGKTVCFDSGGLNLKTSGMADMKRDMSGGANVLAAIEAIAALDVPLSVKAYFAPVFNMTGEDAAKPGDVMHMLGGLTVENLNTDAEGRLTLGEMVEWAQQRGCDWLIDIATLTGAALSITGDAAACLMGNDVDFTKFVFEQGLASGEDMQVLTMFEKIRKYNKQTKNTDLQNIPGSKGAGCVAAGWFIREFVRDNRLWAHLDIAPVMEEGFGVKTFVRIARALAQQIQAKSA
jgi:leucyl aminopeptidase